ncbi:N-acyl homoserine lactonase family protein [Alicyclobacillus fastidiosus]|uniref:N-acyl homoserine lactonase family protein n=1 Tax=Alicyclobacillus fastidiosus TaxID=392011 RepID=UPI0023E994AA|nr:N-acyl homoserine lactonase family protein [Alicyclobacillus fastidiosus]GMA66145.1 MBL fold hydrolase [Alicyclobacillus fastidiosus]
MNYQVYAIEYATRPARASENFYGHHDPHEDYAMTMSYYIWLAVSKEHTVVIDVGFTEEVAQKRKRTFLRCPVNTLRKLDVDPEAVSNVVITHMHYDHVGNAHKFPQANFFVQESEMAFWTGKYASKGHFKSVVEVEDIVHLVRENFNGRLHFVDGTAEILPGISVYKTGGHSAGLQVVKIQSEGGSVILASDASHYYQNLEENRPFTGVYNLAEMYDAFDIVRSLADESSIIVPGHDPLVMQQFPAAKSGLEGIAVRVG